MAEPEEETDEEMRRIADVVYLIEQQINHARAQTAHGVNGMREGLGDGSIQSSPPRQIQHQERSIQVSQSRVVPNRFQEQPVGRKRRAPSNAPGSAPQPSLCLQPSPRPLQALSPPAPQPSQSTVKIEELSSTIAALQQENVRMKTEYTTRIRHLEARVSHSIETNKLRSKLNLAERELRELRTRPMQTQAGEVVEATQTEFEELKASIKPCREGKERIIFGGWGVDKGFADGELRERLFRIPGLVRCADIVTAGVRHNWGSVVEGLVELLEGEGWYVGVQGLGVVLLSKEARAEMVDTTVVRRLLRLRCIEVFTVLEGIIMACAEAGVKGDGVRKCVIVDDYLQKMFKRGHPAAGQVIQCCVVTALECEDGRIGDEEWRSVEEIIVDATRMVSVTTVGNCCLEILACCAVLAGEVLVRCGGIEALLNVVVDGVLTNEEDRRSKALQALKEVCEGHDITVRESVKVIVLPFLLELVRDEDVAGSASFVTAALYNS